MSYQFLSRVIITGFYL